MEQEYLAKALFLRLDPLLRLLSATIERYIELVEPVTDDEAIEQGVVGRQGTRLDNDGHSRNPIMTLEENMIGLLKSQVKLLDALGNELNTILAGPDECVALGPIVPYVILPLQAILKSSVYNNDASTVTLSRQSHLWQCQQGAATVLTAILKRCPSSSIPSERKLTLLMICSMALNGILKSTNHSTEGMNHLHRFDRGEELAKALLRCQQVIIGGVSQEEILSALDYGNLLAGLVVGCIEIISPPNPKGDWSRQDPDLVMEALGTLEILLNRVPQQDQWRELFPGCSAALFHRILATRRTVQPQRITASSVQRLAQLLTVTMKSSKIETRESEDIVELLSRLSQKEGKKEEPDTVDPFVRECNNRLPAPLTLLFNMLPTSASANVRISTISLCRAVLMDTCSIWTAENTVEKHAIQSCIILTNDNDNNVSCIARETLVSFQETDLWNEGEAIATAFEIITELPNFARSLRVLELQSKLRLAQGYLELCSSSSSPREFIAGAEERGKILLSLSSIFDVDFESMQPTPKVTTVTAQFGTSIGSSPSKFRFLSNEIILSAKHLLRTLGRALSSKEACLFVDAAISDLHEACIAREERGFAGPSQVSWVHEWIGSTVVVDQIILGLVDSNNGSAKEQRRTRKRVKALAEALLPLITSSPLWSLPSVHEAASPCTEMRSVSPVSAEALRGNASMLCYLLTFVGTLVDILGPDFVASLPVVLYPLFERYSIHNHSQVQAAAHSVIDKVAKATGSETIENLVSMNLDYLFGALQSKLRLFASMAINCDQPLGYVPSIAKAILSLGMKHASIGKATNLQRSLAAKNSVTIVIKTATDITMFFDRRVVQVAQSNDVDHLLDLIDFFDGSLLHIICSFGLTLANIEERRSVDGSTTEPWMEVLKPFCKDEQSKFDVRDGFAAVLPDTDSTNDKSIDISTFELHYVTMILARCGYLISHPSLTVRVASCKVQSLGFLFLGYITDNFVKGDDEQSSEHAGNAIFRQVSDSWPAIVTRLETLSREFCDSQRPTALSLRLSNALPAPYRSDVTFLSTLFDLIGSMALSSGSFMWGRLEEDVWPVCAKLLETLLSGRSGTRQVVTDSTAPLSDKNKLLRSLFGFYKKLFRNSELAQRAASSISTIGTMILPFIADEDPIGEAAMDTIKTMLSVDNDALWRTLLLTYGQELPPNPYDVLLFRHDEAKSREIEVSGVSVLQSRTKTLIDFANNLPEQHLEYY